MRQNITTLARSAAVYGLGSLFKRALAFVLLPVFTRWLAPGDFGDFALLNACLNVLRPVLCLGLAQSLIWSLTFRRTDERTTVASALGFIVTASVAMSAVLLALAPWICGRVSGGVLDPRLFRLVVLNAAAESIENIALSLWRSRDQAGRFTLVSSLGLILGAALNVWFLVGLHRGVGGLIEAGLITTCVQAILGLLLIRTSLVPVFSWNLVRDMLRYGLPLVPVQIAVISLNVSDRYVLSHYASSFEVGIYALGYNIGMVINLVVQATQLAWAPQMFKIAKEKDADVTLGRLVTGFLIVISFGGLALSVLGNDLIRIMAAPAYEPAGRVVPIVVLSYILGGIAYVTSVGMSTLNRNSYGAIISIAAAVLNLALNFALIPRFGMMGAAWATLISYAAMSAAYIAVNQRLWPIRYQLLRILRIAALWFLLLAAAMQIDHLAIFPRLAGKTALLLAYPLLIIALRAIRPDEIRKLAAIFRKRNDATGVA